MRRRNVKLLLSIILSVCVLGVGSPVLHAQELELSSEAPRVPVEELEPAPEEMIPVPGWCGWSCWDSDWWTTDTMLDDWMYSQMRHPKWQVNDTTVDTTLLDSDGNCIPAFASNLYPVSGEDGHLAAMRLTPHAYPYIVEEIEYPLLHGTFSGKTSCSADFAYTVELYVGSNQTPSADPTKAGANPQRVDTIYVPLRFIYTGGQPGPFHGTWEIIERIRPNYCIELQQGEHLFVAIKMHRVSSTNDVMCLKRCARTNPMGTVNYNELKTDFWSGAASPPYTWEDLDVTFFNPVSDLRVTVHGWVPSVALLEYNP